jgi:hypothetical protein
MRSPHFDRDAARVRDVKPQGLGGHGKAPGTAVQRAYLLAESVIERKKRRRLIPRRAGSPGLRLRAQSPGDEWMAVLSFDHASGDLGAQPAQEFPERLNAG